MEKVKLAKNGYLIMSAVLYAAGVLYIILPGIPLLTVCVITGIALTVYGIVKMIGYFSKDLYCLAFQYDLACGLLFIALGVIVLVRNLKIAPFLLSVTGVLILLDSVLAVQMSKDAKLFGLETWPLILTVSIISGVFGALLIIHPLQSQLASRIMIGGALLASGMKNHCVITCAVAIKESRIPKIEEDE